MRRDKDPMEMPLDMPNMPGQQQFEKPDPKKLVGKEDVTVPAGTFKASHYRDEKDGAVVDFWTSEDAPPLGFVKMTSTPKADAKAGGRPRPGMTMELSARGKDAKATVTKPAKPFDPAALMGGMGGMGRHGGPPPGKEPGK